MRYAPCWKQIGISVARYNELLNFCRQYQEWKAEANSLLGIRALNMDGQPRGNNISNPVATAAEKREKLLAKIAIIEECANAVCGGKWTAAIIQNVCEGRPHEKMDFEVLPTSDRNAYFKVRREFFELLNTKRD